MNRFSTFKSILKTITTACLLMVLCLAANTSFGQAATLPAPAETAARLNKKVDTVKIGAFVTSLYDFNLAESSFKCEFWIWGINSLTREQDSAFYRYNKPLDLQDHLVVKESKETNQEGDNVTPVEEKGLQWYSVLIKSEIRKYWDVKSFPFDKQNVILTVETDELDTTLFVFALDKTNSGLSDSLQSKLHEWEVIDTSFYLSNTTYNTTFGSPILPEGSKSVYSAFNIKIDLKRKNSVLILAKMITGLIIAFVISCCVFFVKPLNTDRFGLSVGGLFAAVGNKYIIETIIPSTNEMTMLDHLHNVTFFYIFLSIILSTISLHVYEQETDDSMKKAVKMDMASFAFILITYIAVCLFIILSNVS